MITIASSLVDLTTRFREGEIVKMIKVRKLTKHKQRKTNDQQSLGKYKHRQKTQVRLLSKVRCGSPAPRQTLAHPSKQQGALFLGRRSDDNDNDNDNDHDNIFLFHGKRSDLYNDNV